MAKQKYQREQQREKANKWAGRAHGRSELEGFCNEAPESIIVIDRQGTIEFLNLVAENFFGFSSEDLKGSNIEILLPRLEASLAESGGDDFLNHRSQIRLGPASHCFAIKQNGTQWPVDITLGPIHYRNKSHIWVFIREVDPSWHTRGAADQSEEHFQSTIAQQEIPVKYGNELNRKAGPNTYNRGVIEASLDPMVVITPDGNIADVNEALVRATHISRKNLIGSVFSDCFTEPEKAHAAYMELFSKGFVADYALTIRPDRREVLYNGSVFRDDEGRVLGAFATARDITVLRKQETRIQALNEELEQRIMELESFSYSVSHDLRQPLRGIDGFVGIFLKKYFDRVDSEGQRLLSNVRRNVKIMGNLIDELLTLSRIGMKELQVTTVDMNKLAKLVVRELDNIRGNASVKIRKLPAAKGDVTLLKRVFVNLLSNAFKYSANQPNPEIEISSYAQNGEMCYYIQDNGVGFDMAYSNKLFGVFQRLHDPIEYTGTGIGLAIVKRIINRHGGKVWAEGKEDEGATFYFSLKSH